MNMSYQQKVSQYLTIFSEIVDIPARPLTNLGIRWNLAQ